MNNLKYIYNRINLNRLSQSFSYYTTLLPFALKNRHKNNDFEHSVVSLFNSPRGGSTWLAEILAKSIPRSALVWEPLFRHKKVFNSVINPFAYPELWKLNVKWHQYLPEDKDYPEFEAFFHKLFNREIVNLKLYRFNKINTIPSADLFIYKFCFANNMLPWLTRHFNIKPVLLVRHPCAVVASQLNFKPFHFVYKKPATFKARSVPDELLHYQDILDSIQTPEESLAARWALNHKLLLDHSQNNINWLTLTYEKLCVAPETELKRLFDYIDRPFPENPEEILYTPSATTSHNSSSSRDIKNKNQIYSWKQKLSQEQIDNILNIVRRFDINAYSDDPEPDYDIVYNKKHNYF